MSRKHLFGVGFPPCYIVEHWFDRVILSAAMGLNREFLYDYRDTSRITQWQGSELCLSLCRWFVLRYRNDQLRYDTDDVSGVIRRMITRALQYYDDHEGVWSHDVDMARLLDAFKLCSAPCRYSRDRASGILAAIVLVVEPLTNDVAEDQQSESWVPVRPLSIWFRRLYRASLQPYRETFDYSRSRRRNPPSIRLTRDHLLLLRSFFGLPALHVQDAEPYVGFPGVQGSFIPLTNAIEGWWTDIERGPHMCPYGPPAYTVYHDSTFHSDVSE